MDKGLNTSSYWHVLDIQPPIGRTQTHHMVMPTTSAKIQTEIGWHVESSAYGWILNTTFIQLWFSPTKILTESRTLGLSVRMPALHPCLACLANFAPTVQHYSREKVMIDRIAFNFLNKRFKQKCFASETLRLICGNAGHSDQSNQKGWSTKCPDLKRRCKT